MRGRGGFGALSWEFGVQGSLGSGLGGFGVRVSGFRFPKAQHEPKAQDPKTQTQTPKPKVPKAQARSGFFWGLGLGGLGSRVSGSGFGARVSELVFRGSGFGVRVSQPNTNPKPKTLKPKPFLKPKPVQGFLGFGVGRVGVSGFGFRVRVSELGFRGSGFGVRVSQITTRTQSPRP